MAAQTPIHVVHHVADGPIAHANVTVAGLILHTGADVPFLAEVVVRRKLVESNPQNFLTGFVELEDPLDTGIQVVRIDHQRAAA